MTEKKKRLITALVFAVAVLLITFRFTDTPKVWVDEGVFTETAKNLAWHGVLGLQTEPGSFFPMAELLSTGYPVVFPVAASFWFFGIGVVQARLPMLVYMFLLTALFYLFAKKKYGFLAAVLSVALLVSFSPFYGNGRPVQGEVPGLFFVVLGLWFLELLQRSRFTRSSLALGSGIAFGLAAATKPIYLFGLGGALVFTLIFWFRKIESKKNIFFVALGFILPLVLEVLVQFRGLAALRSIVPTYLHLASNHSSSLSVWKTILINVSRFFTESTPTLFLLLITIVVCSFLFRLLKKKDNAPGISEYVGLFFILLNIVSYLPGTGWYRYFFPAHILVYLLFPGALVMLTQSISRPWLRNVLYGGVTALILFQFAHLAFVSDTSFTVKRTRNADLAAALSKVKSSQKVLFYNSVETVIFMPGRNYSQYLSMGDFLEAGNKRLLENPDADLIVMSDGSRDSGFYLPCYTRVLVSRYYVFTKNNDCQKK